MNSTNLTQVGQYIVDDCTITASNGKQFQASNIVVGIQLYEDLYSAFITGYIVLRDGLGIIDSLPLRGEESISLRLRTPTLNEKYQMVDEVFYMYSMQERLNVDKKTQDYVIGICTRETMLNKLIRVGEGFADTGSNIALTLLQDQRYLGTEKPLTIEPTNTFLNYTSNYWTINENLQYITSMSTNQSGVANFVYFENRFGINVISLDSLFAYSPVYQKFYYDDYTNPIGGINMDKSFQRVEQFQIISSYDYMRDTQNGMLSSIDFSYDSVRKVYNSNVFNYQDNFVVTAHLNDDPLYSEGAVIPLFGKMVQTPRAFDTYGNGDQSAFSTIQQRASMLNTLNARKIKIAVPGRFDYTVGQIVEFETYTTKPLQKGDDPIDYSVSGKYVISALQHVMTKTNHTCVMELSTDSIKRKP